VIPPPSGAYQSLYRRWLRAGPMRPGFQTFVCRVAEHLHRPGGHGEALLVRRHLAEPCLLRGEAYSYRDWLRRVLCLAHVVGAGTAGWFEFPLLRSFGQAGTYLLAEPAGRPAEFFGLAQPEVLLWLGQRGYLGMVAKAQRFPSARQLSCLICLVR
jgi:hypothetical protein